MIISFLANFYLIRLFSLFWRRYSAMIVIYILGSFFLLPVIILILLNFLIHLLFKTQFSFHSFLGGFFFWVTMCAFLNKHVFPYTIFFFHHVYAFTINLCLPMNIFVFLKKRYITWLHGSINIKFICLNKNNETACVNDENWWHEMKRFHHTWQ